MTRSRCVSALCVGAMALLSMIVRAEETPIVRDGQLNATIVIPDGASDAVTASAESLRKSIKESFGADIPIVVENARPTATTRNSGMQNSLSPMLTPQAVSMTYAVGWTDKPSTSTSTYAHAGTKNTCPGASTF